MLSIGHIAVNAELGSPAVGSKSLVWNVNSLVYLDSVKVLLGNLFPSVS